MKQIFAGVVFFLLTYCSANAQVDYPVFKSRSDINPADSGKLSFSFYNLDYINNTEWFTKIPLSGTLFGYQLIPELQYQPSGRFLIKAGVYLQKEFGRKEYTSLLPTFSVKYRAKHSSYIIGTLEGNLNHGFIEPIYDYKLLINERLENGFQFLVDTKPYTHDFYINWRRAIHLNDPFKEEFDVGLSSRFNVLTNDKIEVGVPIQFLYSHKGGQLDTAHTPVQSLTNTALGLSLAFKVNKWLLKRIVFDNYYVNYKDISGQKRQPFNQGNAFLSHLLFDFKNVGVDFRYWNGDAYIGPRGMALFQSVSEKIPGYVEKHRELLLTSLIYDKEIYRNINFDFRFNPYYDFVEKRLEYSFELYLSYSLNVFLKR